MLRMLGMFPQVQEELIKEIDENIDSIEKIKFEDLTEKLPKLTAFMKEAMRIKTPVGGVARIVSKKGGETINGIHVPQGTTLTISVFAQHLLSYNSAGDEPNLQRFLDPIGATTAEEKLDRGTMGNLQFDFAKEELIPFSLGPRDCIGRRMAMLEMKLILTFILKQYRLVVPPHLKEAQSKIKETYIITRTGMESFILNFEKRN